LILKGTLSYQTVHPNAQYNPISLPSQNNAKV